MQAAAQPFEHQSAQGPTQQHQAAPGHTRQWVLQVGNGGHGAAHQSAIEAVDPFAAQAWLQIQLTGRGMCSTDAEQRQQGRPGRLRQKRQQQHQTAERIVDEDHLGHTPQPSQQRQQAGVKATGGGMQPVQGARGGQQPLQPRGQRHGRLENSLEQIEGGIQTRIHRLEAGVEHL